MTDEFIDIVNEEGIFTGEVKLKSEAHKLGLYHSSVHIWLYTHEREVLIQKRALDKDTYPGLWDISVAGHIGTGESPENAALREIQEEIGYTITSSDLEFIGKSLAQKKPSPAIIDNEFHYIYLTPLNKSIKDLKIQKEEVHSIKLIPLTLLKKELAQPIKKKEYVPHDVDYYDFVLNEIENRFHQ